MMVVVAMRHSRLSAQRLRAVSEGVTQHVAQAWDFMTVARHGPAAGKEKRLLHDKDIGVGCFLALSGWMFREQGLSFVLLI